MRSDPQRRRKVVVAVVALTTAGTTGAAFAPTLLTYSPLLLIALSAIPRHLVLAAPLTELLPFVAVGALRRLLTCTLMYFVGESFGESGLSWLEKRYPKLRRIAHWLERAMRKSGRLVLLVAPSPALCALAGAMGLPLWHVVPSALLGQIGWVAVTYWVGDVLSVWTTPLLTWLREHVVGATIATFILVVGYELIRRHRQRSRGQAAIHGAPDA